MGITEVLDVLLKLAVVLAGAGAVYGGIRADLKSAHLKADEALSRANGAHHRIDGVLRGGFVEKRRFTDYDGRGIG